MQNPDTILPYSIWTDTSLYLDLLEEGVEYCQEDCGCKESYSSGDLQQGASAHT